MADALLSPAIGGTFWAASAGAIAWCAKKVQQGLDDRNVPLMGVLGAFIFAAQMINFTIPGTGSSGHIGGGILLAILLGPYAALLTIASVLVVQALFFADGGLLALGCNIFNMGFLPCFLAYPLLYKPIAGSGKSRRRIAIGAIFAAIAGMQLGAFGVVCETVLSGISALPMHTFLWAMLPIHLAIGLIEGLITASVVTFVWQARPEILDCAAGAHPQSSAPITKVLICLAVAAALISGVCSWFASKAPDGLEWSIARVTGQKELAAPLAGIHGSLAGLQEKTALLPGYGFRNSGQEPAVHLEGQSAWPAVDPGATVAGLVGGGLTFLLIIWLALVFRKRRRAA
ncbi:MAG: energy-coupling factor ABC transporter permease [Desulfobulbus sp.]|nr:energy-coupling factor ABC transporter permease [Desulfobulbus sp.]